MSLYKEWTDLMANQTDETFEAFWKTYSGTEKKIYSDILDHPQDHFSGSFSELAKKYDADPVIFTGFLDGIQGSLISGELKLEDVDENTEIDFEIDFEKLFFNMHKADAEYLYSLKQWKTVLGEEKMAEIFKITRNQRPLSRKRKSAEMIRVPAEAGKNTNTAAVKTHNCTYL